MSALERVTDLTTATRQKQDFWDELEHVHHQEWRDSSSIHNDENRQTVAIRIQSLTASFNARRAILQTQIQGATNDRIRIMRSAELHRAQNDYDTRLRDLRLLSDRGDIHTTPLIFGELEVTRS